MNLSDYVSFEVAPCETFVLPDGTTYTENCDPSEAQFWTVYGRLPDGEAEAITDVSTEERAHQLAAEFTARVQ